MVEKMIKLSLYNLTKVMDKVLKDPASATLSGSIQL